MKRTQKMYACVGRTDGSISVAWPTRSDARFERMQREKIVCGTFTWEDGKNSTSKAKK
jgi:hypothetical protein